MSEPNFFEAMNEQCAKQAQFSYSDVNAVKLAAMSDPCVCYRPVFDALRKAGKDRFASIGEYLAYGVNEPELASNVLRYCIAHNCCKLHTAAIMHKIPQTMRTHLRNYGVPK